MQALKLRRINEGLSNAVVEATRICICLSSRTAKVFCICFYFYSSSSRFCMRLFKVYVTPVASIGIFARYFHLLVDHN